MQISNGVDYRDKIENGSKTQRPNRLKLNDKDQIENTPKYIGTKSVFLPEINGPKQRRFGVTKRTHKNAVILRSTHFWQHTGICIPLK